MYAMLAASAVLHSSNHGCLSVTVCYMPNFAHQQELEDMLLRYERQLKAEINARQAAETAAAEALAAVGQVAGSSSSTQHQQQPHQLAAADWEHQQALLQQVRMGFYACRTVKPCSL